MIGPPVTVIRSICLLIDLKGERSGREISWDWNSRGFIFVVPLSAGKNGGGRLPLTNHGGNHRNATPNMQDILLTGGRFWHISCR